MAQPTAEQKMTGCLWFVLACAAVAVVGVGLLLFR